MNLYDLPGRERAGEQSINFGDELGEGDGGEWEVVESSRFAWFGAGPVAGQRPPPEGCSAAQLHPTKT